VTVAADRIDIRLSRAKVAAALGAQALDQRPDLDPVVLSIEAKLRRAGKGKRLVIENGAAAKVNAGLAAMVAEALAIRNQLLSGPDDSIEAMIERLGIARGRLTSLVLPQAPAQGRRGRAGGGAGPENL
jgi:site-specific DNA recombinase